jgi:hypothetical protein
LEKSSKSDIVGAEPIKPPSEEDVKARFWIDVRPPIPAETVEEARTLAERIAASDKRMVFDYFELGRLVASVVSLGNSIREFARNIDRHGFGFVTLSWAHRLYLEVQNNYDTVEDFVAFLHQRYGRVTWRAVKFFLGGEVGVIDEAQSAEEEWAAHKTGIKYLRWKNEALLDETEEVQLDRTTGTIRRKGPIIDPKEFDLCPVCDGKGWIRKTLAPRAEPLAV